MKKYQIIARKYRPQTFFDVVGQETVVTTLKNALRFNRLAHAYLFCGCRGTGKTTLARVFAKALNCGRVTQDFEPCNTCSSCLDIIAGRSLDVLEIDGASNRGIDDIRQINETIGYAASNGKYKIYIIDEVHMLTKEAFNALLKTLEEPPENVKFFFATTEPHKVLPTIISRCQRFDLNRISLEALKKKLSHIAEDLKIECDEEVLSWIANLAEGSLRDAESLFDQVICYAEQPITLERLTSTLGILPQSAFFSFDQAFVENNLSFAFELADSIFSSGKDLAYFIDSLIEHYRTLYKVKLNHPVSFSSLRLKEQYLTSAAIYSEDNCLYILDFLIHWQQNLNKTPFKRIHLEMILLHLLRSKHRTSLPSLVKRLFELEQHLHSSLDTNHQGSKHNESQVANPSLEDNLLKKIQNKMEILSTPLKDNLSFNSQPIRELISTEHIQAQAPISSPIPSELIMEKTAEAMDLSTAISTTMTTVIIPEQALVSPTVNKSVPDTKQIETPLTNSDENRLALPKPTTVAQGSEISQSRLDTLVRFAAVELEGIIKKE